MGIASTTPISLKYWVGDKFALNTFELDCELKVCKQDKLGRYVIMKGLVQSQPFIFVNIYAPNKVNEQCVFYDEIHDELAKVEADVDHRIIVGGDFNVILDPDLDGSGGKPKFKES